MFKNKKKKRMFEEKEEQNLSANNIDVTSVGLAAFNDFISYNKEDYNKKVDILKNLFKQVFKGVDIKVENEEGDIDNPSIRKEDDDKKNGIVYFVLSTQERTIIFPVYNGYIELAGVNYGFDSKGCIDLINVLSYYLDTPLNKKDLQLKF